MDSVHVHGPWTYVFIVLWTHVFIVLWTHVFKVLWTHVFIVLWTHAFIVLWTHVFKVLWTHVQGTAQEGVTSSTRVGARKNATENTKGTARSVTSSTRVGARMLQCVARDSQRASPPVLGLEPTENKSVYSPVDS